MEIVYGKPVHLGQQQAYSEQYDASLLQPIERSICRAQLPIKTFSGVDLWTAFEVSWLDAKGKPCVAALEFEFPANSSHIIESKSFKYYLNSFNQTRLSSKEELIQRLLSDLSSAAGGQVMVREYVPPEAMGLAQQVLLDELALVEPVYSPAPELLSANGAQVHEVVCSHLLKTNCPVTGQPDWASLWIGYEGAQIDHNGLLAYIVSFRQQQDFHENCVEHIYCDLWQRCAPRRLWVYARYTRRGGLDINPLRSSEPMAAPKLRGFRQ